MKWQKPAEGIMKIGEFGLTKTYNIACECGNPDCSHILDIDADDHGVSVSVYLTTRSLFKDRWKQIWSLLTKGEVETSTTIVMSRQTAMNYAATLKAAVEDVEKLRDETKSS
jgi:hypothetical protein